MRVAGSGTAVGATMSKVNESAVPPATEPHVHTYVPGVTPRLANVWLANVLVADNEAPET